VPVGSRIQHISDSVAEDICSATTSGRWTMPKHLLLGMTLRHLTGSAQIITLVNKFGHCCSYTECLRLENAMAVHTKSRDSVLPSNISLTGSKIIHTCFDNFDILEETPSGAGTTHSTHGIVIQELEPEVCSAVEPASPVPDTSQSKTKQERVKFVVETLPQYIPQKRVEPSLPTSKLPVADITSQANIKPSELVWTLCRSTANVDCIVPQWSGWVSATTCEPKVVLQSVIGFMQPILNPITEYETVHQCMMLSLEVTHKVGQQYSFVTMDLAAAKIAFDIKFHKPGQFRNVLIHLGGFHISCSYMGSLGKMMCGSGFEDVIIEAGICASGSLDKVLAGKHYNRAVRVHQLMLETLERLLLQAFVIQSGRTLPDVCDLRDVTHNLSATAVESLTGNEEFIALHAQFSHFRRELAKGTFGATAKFWFGYMQSVWHLLRFIRAVKENDLDMYMDAMLHMTGLLFSTNHHNYARYLPLYCQQLHCLPETHPGAVEMLRDNGFTVSRSPVPACRNSVDITIEQTINRSAKTSGGIVGFSRKPSAYTRWCLTRHTRGSYAEATFARIGISTNSSDIHKSLQATEIRNSDESIRKLVDTFQKFMDPFSIASDQHDNIYSISSGMPASDKVAEDLSRYIEVGADAAADFFANRLWDKTVKFHDPIKRMNLKTFAAMAVTKKLTTTQKKSIEVKAERNLLGRLLLLSQQHDISLAKVFRFPLGPIPWSLATADGCMVKTSKVQLLHHLEALAVPLDPESQPSHTKSIAILDGNALLQAMTHIPETFEEFACQVFRCLPPSEVVHFVTDSYKPASIKQFERSRRGQARVHIIGGPKTRMPQDFKAFMSNDDNKRQLIRFLLTEWQSNAYASRFHGRSIFFVREEECFCLHSSDGVTTSSAIVRSLCSEQEEADTRIMLHCHHAVRTSTGPVPITVRSPDTDVFVILLSYADSIPQPLIFDTGTGNKRRLLDIKAIANVLGSGVASALPGFHSFTGCDCTSAFVRRGKLKPFKLLQSSSRFQEAFRELGNSDVVNDDLFGALQAFVCSMYGHPHHTDVNKVRYDIFESRYGMKKPDKAFSIPDGIDLSMLPPCQASLRLHTMRSNYVAYIWKNAHVPYPKIPPPTNSGWVTSADAGIDIQWTDGDIMPRQLLDVLEPTTDDCCDEGDGTLEVVEEDDETDNILDVVFEDDVDL